MRKLVLFLFIILFSSINSVSGSISPVSVNDFTSEVNDLFIVEYADGIFYGVITDKLLMSYGNGTEIHEPYSQSGNIVGLYGEGEYIWILLEIDDQVFVEKRTVPSLELVLSKEIISEIDGSHPMFRDLAVQDTDLFLMGVDADYIYKTPVADNLTEYAVLEVFPDNYARTTKNEMSDFAITDNSFWVPELGGTTRSSYGRSSSSNTKFVRGDLDSGEGSGYIEVDLTEVKDENSIDGYYRGFSASEEYIYVLFSDGNVVTYSLQEILTDKIISPIHGVLFALFTIQYFRRKNRN